MPGVTVFPTLTTANSTTVTVNGGKQDGERTTVASRVSEPVFVDNAIYHAIYEKSTDSTGRHYTVTKPLKSDFQVTHGKRYSFVEEEDALLVTHKGVDGIKNTVPPFFNDVRLETGKTPPVLLFTGDESLRVDSITTATNGSRLNLKNLKGQTLKQLGMPEVSDIRAGQIVNVGLRSTDIVMRLFKDKKHSLNSISLGKPYSGASLTSTTTYKGNNTIGHSTSFISRNFRSGTIPNVLRTIARHDHHSMVTDRFGNFIYTSKGFNDTGVKLPTALAGNVTISNVADTPNRVVVRGIGVALNDDNEVTLDDAERQKAEGVVKSETYNDPTATSLAATKKSANLMLRMNRKATGSIQIGDLPAAVGLSPGDVVEYTPTSGPPRKEAIIEVTHDLSDARSKVTLVTYETGIERVLGNTKTEQENDKENKVTAGETVTKKKVFNLGSADLRVTGVLTTRRVAVNKSRLNSSIDGFTFANTGNEMHSGFLLGHRGVDIGDSAGRSALGTGLTPRTTGSHNAGTITVSSTSGFPSSGHLMMRKTASDAAHVAYTGKTSTTFTGVTLQAPSGGSIPTGSCDLTLLRAKSHEIGVVKGISHRSLL
tara:strand:- start:2309 stop:4099 length:1791 start_codon:yes stop_codon:yes gene_type:complete